MEIEISLYHNFQSRRILKLGFDSFILHKMRYNKGGKDELSHGFSFNKLFFLQSFSAYAGDCEDVYRNAMRNVNFYESNSSSLNSVFDNICSSSGEKKNHSWDASIDAVVEFLPVSLTGNSINSTEKANNFCRNYSNQRYSATHNLITTDNIVVESQSNYNTCKEIEARTGVTITHKFADPDAIVVNFDFKNTNSILRVSGVHTTNMSCRANDAPTWHKALDISSNFEMRDDFAIICERARSEFKDSDSISYLPSSLAIATNSESYVISLPSDSIYGNELASEASKKILDLETSLGAISDELESANSSLEISRRFINGIKITQHRVMIGDRNPGGGFKFYGCYTDINTVEQQLCKGAFKSMSAQAMTRSRDRCGYGSYVVSCLYVGK